LLKEITDLTNQLQSVVESARQARAAAAWAKMKGQVRDAAKQAAGAKPQ
jgi:hypothetical protein